MTYYLLGRYREAVDAGDRALSRNPRRNTQMIAYPMMAAAYAGEGRRTQEAQDQMLEGLRKAGFH